MTLNEAKSIICLIRSKYRFYGVSTTSLDSNLKDIRDYLVFGRLGLAVIESVEKPSDAYYIQNVVFPAFVKRVFPSKSGVKVDYSFEKQLKNMMIILPDFYQDVITWPVIRFADVVLAPYLD